MAAALISLTRMPGTGPTPTAKLSTYASVPTSAMVPLMDCADATEQVSGFVIQSPGFQKTPACPPARWVLSMDRA